MSDRRYYAKIDVGYLDNPKLGDFVDDSKGVVLLHLRAILYCAQHLTDGVFPIARVCRLAAASYCGASHHDECTMQCTMHSAVHCTEGCIPLCDWCAAASVGLVNRLDARNGEVHDYLEHQESSQRVAERSAARQRAARARWGAPKKAPRDASCIAPSNAGSNADEMRRDEKRKTLAHEAQEAHGCVAADAATRESEPKDEPPPLLTVEAEKPAPKTRPSGRDLDAAFAKFWDAYPRKKSKAAGRAAYEKAARKVGPERIRAALEAQLPALMAKEPDFRPYPATWLNRESWEDEPDAPARSGPLVVSGPRSVDGAIHDDAGTYSGWIHPTPVVRGGVVVHDPLGALGEPVVGGDHDWWAEQGALSASESPAGSKRGEVPIRAVRAS